MKHRQLSLEEIRIVATALRDARATGSNRLKTDQLFRMFERAENVTLELSQTTMSLAGNLGERRSGQGAAR
jgi:hypothetical protein